MSTETKSRKGIGGPNTREGKEKIRLNALKMGLHSYSLVGMQAVADVIGVTFEEIHEKMMDHYQPADYLEETLVHRIARCTWKLRLIQSIEDNALYGLTVSSAPGSSLEALSVIERRTDVQLHRAISALNHKRKKDQEKVKNKLTEPLPQEQSTPQPQPVPCSITRHSTRSRAFPSQIRNKKRVLDTKPRRGMGFAAFMRSSPEKHQKCAGFA